MKEYIVDTTYGDTYCKEVYGDEGLPNSLLMKLSTKDIKVLSSCRIEPSIHHGSITAIHGFAKLKDPVTVEICDTLVTTPYLTYFFEIYRDCGNREITNYMSNVRLCAPVDCLLEGEEARLYRKIERLMEYEAGAWGSKAFWDDIPTDTLTGPDLIVRRFIENMVQASEAHHWAEQAKEKWKTIKQQEVER